MPTQDGAWGDQAVAPKCSGQPPDQGGEHGPVGPVQAWSRVGASEHRDLVPQHEELDVLDGGRAAHQQGQAEDLLEGQVEQSQQHDGDHAKPMGAIDPHWSTACAMFWNPAGAAVEPAPDDRRCTIASGRRPAPPTGPPG